MEVFSHYGMGTKAYAIERKEDGRVEFTIWGTLFWLPVIPRSFWSAYYVGPSQPDSIKEDGHRFADESKIHRGLLSYVLSVAISLLMLALAVSPICYLIFWTAGRAASTLEMVLVYAACMWPVVLILLMERRRNKLLTGTKG